MYLTGSGPQIFPGSSSGLIGKITYEQKGDTSTGTFNKNY